MSTGKQTPDPKQSSTKSSPSNNDRYDDSKEEMMVIDINFGKDRSDEIVVHFGDDPRDLAEAFVKKHGLKATSVNLIAKHIEMTIQDFKEANTEIRPQTPPAEDHYDHEVGGSLVSPSNDRLTPADLPEYSSPASNHNASRRSSPETSQRGRSHTPENTTPRSTEDRELRRTPSSDIRHQPSERLSSQHSHRHHHQHHNPKHANQDSSEAESGTEAEPDDVESGSHQEHASARRSPKGRRSSMVVERDRERDRELEWDDGHKHNRVLQPSPSHRYQHHRDSPTGGSLRSHNSRDFRNAAELKPTSSAFDLHSTGEIGLTEPGKELQSPGPVTAEDRYNKLKKGFSATNNNNKKSTANKNTEDLLGILQPKSSTLRLDPSGKGGARNSGEDGGVRISGNLSVASNMTPVPPVAKTASERLYLSAQTTRARMECKKKKADHDEESDRKEHSFRVSGGSKSMLGPRAKQYDADVGNRLYQDAKTEKVRKQQEREKIKLTPTPEEWSCVKCGTFQKSSKLDLKALLASSAAPSPVFPSSNSQNSHLNSQTGPETFTDSAFSKDVSKPQSVKRSVERVCISCGFSQPVASDFKPVILTDLAGAGEEQERNKSQRRYADDGETLFDYLHANTRQQTMKLNQMKSVWKELDKVMTFKPVLPIHSTQLVKQLATKSEKSDKMPDSPGEASQMTRESDEFSNKHEKDEVKLSEYVGLPVMDRLTKVKSVKKQTGKPVDTMDTLKSSFDAPAGPLAGTFASNAGKVNKKCVRPANTINTGIEGVVLKPKKEISRLVERLVAENEEITAKRESAQRVYYSTDPKSGQPLYKPKIPPPPKHAAVSSIDSSSSKKPKNIADAILAKDQALREHRKQMEDAAAEKLKSDFVKNKASALPQSEQILQQATQRSIEEMYRLLLASTHDHVLRDGAHFSESERADTVSRLSGELVDWEHATLDLSLVEPTLMIPEVQSLLQAVVQRKYKLLHGGSAQSVCDMSQASPRLSQHASDPVTATASAQSSMTLQELQVVPVTAFASPPPPPPPPALPVVAAPTPNRVAAESSLAVVPAAMQPPLSQNAIVPATQGKRMSRALESKRALTVQPQSDTTRSIDGNAPMNTMTLGVENDDDDDNDEDDDLLLLMMPPPPPLNPQPQLVTAHDTESLDLTRSDTQIQQNNAIGNGNPEVGLDDISALAMESQAGRQPLIVTYPEFKDLVLYCLKKRNGPGRNYVFAPKKKPEVTMNMIKKVLAEETFAPQIDPISESLSQNRQGRGQIHRQSLSGSGRSSLIADPEMAPNSIVDVLYREGKRMKERALEIKKVVMRDEVKECTFKPTLFKPPKSVVPRYRGLNDSVLDQSQSTTVIMNTSTTSDQMPGTPDDESVCVPAGPTALDRQFTVMTASSHSASSSVADVSYCSSGTDVHGKRDSSASSGIGFGRPDHASGTARTAGRTAGVVKKATPIFKLQSHGQDHLPMLPVEIGVPAASSPVPVAAPAIASASAQTNAANLKLKTAVSPASTPIAIPVTMDHSQSSSRLPTDIGIPVHHVKGEEHSAHAEGSQMNSARSLNSELEYVSTTSSVTDTFALEPNMASALLHNRSRSITPQGVLSSMPPPPASSTTAAPSAPDTASGLSPVPDSFASLSELAKYSETHFNPASSPAVVAPRDPVVPHPVLSAANLNTAVRSIRLVGNDSHDSHQEALSSAPRLAPSPDPSMNSGVDVTPGSVSNSSESSSYQHTLQQYHQHSHSMHRARLIESNNTENRGRTTSLESFSQYSEHDLIEPMEDNEVLGSSLDEVLLGSQPRHAVFDDRRLSGLSDRSGDVLVRGTSPVDGDNAGYESDKTSSTRSSLTQIKEGTSPRVLTMRSALGPEQYAGLGAYAAAMADEFRQEQDAEDSKVGDDLQDRPNSPDSAHS